MSFSRVVLRRVIVPSTSGLMRPIVIAGICVSLAAGDAMAQAVVAGEVVLKEGGRPLEFTTVEVQTPGRQLLTNEKGRFRLPNLPAGELRLRFKRIGFAPHDTTLVLAAGDTARIRIEMTRLVIQLPEMLVSGRCTNETPREPVPGFLAQLIDQIMQNSERMALLVAEKPFQVRIERIDGLVDRNNVVSPIRGDTTVRSNPLPDPRYKPLTVLFKIATGPYRGAWGVNIPELADIADTAFTNNHCFRYAGRGLIGADSVLRVEFVPVPWLDREVDLSGTLYLKVDGYQMVGSFTRLNRLMPFQERAGLEEYFVDARFKEIVPGVPILDSWELTNRFRGSRPRFVQRGRTLAIEWKDSTTATLDTIRNRY